MKVNNINKNRKDQQGVALIFAIGMLSLLMFLGLAFVTNAVLTQKVAYNNSSRSQAKMLAQTAVNRLSGHIMHHQLTELRNTGSSTGVDYTQVHSFAGTANNGTASSDFIQQGAANSLLAYNDGFQNHICNSPVHWQFVENDSGELTGRFAYWILPTTENGTLDLNQVEKGFYNLGNPTGNAANPTPRQYRIGKDISELNILTPNSFFVDMNVPGDTTSYDWSSEPLLVPDLESYFTVAFDGVTKDREDSLAWLRSWFAETGNVRIDPEVYYFDSGSDIKAMNRFDLTRNDWSSGLGVSAPANSDGMVRALMMLDASDNNDPDIEANLRFSAADLQSIPEVGLPFLKKIGATDFNGDGVEGDLEGTFSNILYLRKQVAANLIDYCDNDNIPTSDVPAAQWSASDPAKHPKYTGNEKTSYINELAFANSITITSNDTGRTIGRFTVTLTPQFFAELINIYEFPTQEEILQTRLTKYDVQLTVKGTRTITCRALFGGGTRTATQTFNIPLTISAAAQDIELTYPLLATPPTTAYRLATKQLTAITSPQQTVQLSGLLPGIYQSAAWKFSVQVTKVTAEFDGVVLKNNASGVDFVSPGLKIETSDAKYLLVEDPASTAEVELTGDAITKYNKFFAVGLEANDPRQNLNVGDWKHSNKLFAFRDVVNNLEWSSLTADAAGTFTDGARNTGSNPSGRDSALADAETVTDPAWSAASHLSTAYIANEPMKSLWELGAIHRGIAWQTINLKKAPSGLSLNSLHNVNAAPDADGYTYEEGDGALLDQVKLIDDAATSSTGKIDLNKLPAANTGWDQQLIASVFAGIALGQQYADLHNAYNARTPAGGGITAAEANTITNNLYQKNSTWESRAELLGFNVGTNYFYDGFGLLAMTTDAAQEELVGKTINLFKTQLASQQPESDTIRAVVVAQTIKDIGDTSAIPVTRFRPSNGSAETQNCQLGVYEPPIPDGNDYVYFDEITSEVKLLVTFRRNWEQVDPLRKTYSIKVQQIEYID